MESGKDDASTSPPKRVVVLGSSGSIGTSALRVAADLPEEMKVVGLAVNSNITTLAKQVAETGVKRVAIFQKEQIADARKQLPANVEVLGGMEGLCELATMEEADVVLVAIVGVAGLWPALAAIEAGKNLAVASKEILVMAGELVMARAAKRGVSVLPVDSEHNAIFQCLQGHGGGESEIQRLILTASGGPFRQTPVAELESVTLAQALKHPTWKMGRKITIDSATLFNKALEMIEARWLFGVPMSKVEVVVHPQSIVHSMVEFIDGSILAQLSVTDMCFPIQYAVTWPKRLKNRLPALDLASLGKLEFEEPRRQDFLALDLASWAGEVGGSLPAVLNAANEVAVERFVAGEISFPKIWHLVQAVMSEHEGSITTGSDLGELEAIDSWARQRARASSI